MNTITNDQPYAKILGRADHGVTMTASASRISTTNGTALSIYEKSINNENNEKLIKAVLSSGHRSVMEHCYFNIAFNNVSVFVEQYIIEFRLASFTVQSRRYVDFSTVKFHIPDALPEKVGEIFAGTMQSLMDDYGKLLALDIPKEDARFVLPYCFFSNFYCSCNARELLHMICTMIYGRGSAFPEIAKLGAQLASDFEEYFPTQIEKFKDKYAPEHERTLAWIDSLKARQINNPSVCMPSVELLSHSTMDSSLLCEISNYNFASVGADAPLFSSRARELEMLNFCFKINSLSLSSITHLVRHRVQSVLVPCIGNALFIGKYILPDSVKTCPEALEIYSKAFLKSVNAYKECMALDMDITHCIYFALSGNTLDCISSMNGRELSHFISLRTCTRAQWEIRAVATDMRTLAKNVYPDIFSQTGPTCYSSGACPEGKKSCGQMKEMREIFGK